MVYSTKGRPSHAPLCSRVVDLVVLTIIEVPGLMNQNVVLIEQFRVCIAFAEYLIVALPLP